MITDKSMESNLLYVSSFWGSICQKSLKREGYPLTLNTSYYSDELKEEQDA